MNAANLLLADLATIGATVEPAGDRLILRAGPNAIPAALVNRVRAAKAELIETLTHRSSSGEIRENGCLTEDGWSAEDWQAFYEERAGIAEFDGMLPRPEGEALAFVCCVAEWLNRNSVRSPAGRCIGCGGGNHAHDPLLPYGTEVAGHAWLHSRCWPAWDACRKAEAAAALVAMRIATPAKFPDDFGKNGGA